MKKVENCCCKGLLCCLQWLQRSPLCRSHVSCCSIPCGRTASCFAITNSDSWNMSELQSAASLRAGSDQRGLGGHTDFNRPPLASAGVAQWVGHHPINQEVTGLGHLSGLQVRSPAGACMEGSQSLFPFHNATSKKKSLSVFSECRPQYFILGLVQKGRQRKK